MNSAYAKSKNGGFTMKLVKKIKLTYQYYKSLELYPVKKEMHQIKYINKSIIIT